MRTLIDKARWQLILPGAGAAVAAWLLRRPLMQVSGLAAGGVLLAFFIVPVTRLFEGKLSRSAAALWSMVAVLGGLALALWLTLPMLSRALRQLGETLPRSLAQLSDWLNAASTALQRRLPGLGLPQARPLALTGLLPHLAQRAMTFAGGFADGVSRLSLMVMLCFFFLCERENLLLRLEWMIPLRWRAAAAKAGRALDRELRLYLQGQLMVAAVVGALATAGLALARVRGAAALGLFVGVFNMVPYFGPYLGGIPALLIALGDGWRRAAICLGVLALVQQLDNTILSPRVMGGVTGFSPAAVLLAIYAGASLGGIVGMLTALPAIMSIRTVYRVFVQSLENI